MKSVILATLGALAVSQNILTDLEDQVREGRSLERDDGDLRQLSWGHYKKSKYRKEPKCTVIQQASAILVPADQELNGLDEIVGD